jgi:hypothetical protein
MRYGTEIEKLQLNDLLKYIYSFKDEHLGEKDKKILIVFLVQLMIKLYDNKITYKKNHKFY